jgi:phosphate:Na+ symporter
MIDTVTWMFSVIAAVVLFLYGLAAFSEEVTRIGGEQLRAGLRRATRHDPVAALIGAGLTALVQSSSAVTSMAVGLVHNRALPARGAFAVMIGANVGTTLTAWLVALKIAGLGPAFISIGGLWSLFGPRSLRPFGKAVFYFGLVFLALDMTAQALAPLASNPAFESWRDELASPAVALAFGAVLTALVQSSSVITGLAVMTVQQGLLPPEVAVWMVAGANLGTTSTALLASSALDKLSRKLALLNTALNAFGVVLFATVLQPLIGWLLQTGMTASDQVALVHTVFNVAAACAALLLMPVLWPHLHAWLGRSSGASASHGERVD